MNSLLECSLNQFTHHIPPCRSCHLTQKRIRDYLEPTTPSALPKLTPSLTPIWLMSDIRNSFDSHCITSLRTAVAIHTRLMHPWLLVFNKVLTCKNGSKIKKNGCFILFEGVGALGDTGSTHAPGLHLLRY